jgi:hypothetical protein
MVSLIASVGSFEPDTLIAQNVNDLPLSVSRIAPPKQVAAPPNGSASVGEL